MARMFSYEVRMRFWVTPLLRIFAIVAKILPRPLRKRWVGFVFVVIVPLVQRYGVKTTLKR
jgi:hypothetical protein